MWALTSLLSTGPLVHNKRTTSEHTTCTIHRQLTYCSPCFRYRHINWPQCNIPNPVLVLHFSHPSGAFHSKIGSMTTHACNWCLSGQNWPRVPHTFPGSLGPVRAPSTIQVATCSENPDPFWHHPPVVPALDLHWLWNPSDWTSLPDRVS